MGEKVINLDIALVGFGVVGRNFAKLLLQQKDLLRRRNNLTWRIVMVADRDAGHFYDPHGLDVEGLLEGRVSATCASCPSPSELVKVIQDMDASVLVEATPTNLDTAEPAESFIKASLSSGKHVITTNKGPVAIAMTELEQLAEESGVYFGYEGTVLSGTPCISLGASIQRGAQIQAIEGILNGTCNYILSAMEQGVSYEEALATAQRLGYAEADPASDVDGWDAAAKIVILGKKLLNLSLKVPDIKREGISSLSQAMIEQAAAEDKRLKLVARAERRGREVTAEVEVIPLPSDHIFCHITGVMNAVTFRTETTGDITIVGPGAGGKSAAQALVYDLIKAWEVQALNG